MTFGAGGQRSNPLSYGRGQCFALLGSSTAWSPCGTPGFTSSPGWESASPTSGSRQGVPEQSLGTPYLNGTSSSATGGEGGI